MPFSIISRETQQTRGNIQTLDPDIWLKDEIIYSYLKVCLSERARSQWVEDINSKGRQCFYNSFFFPKSYDEHNKDVKLRDMYDYTHVCNWGEQHVTGTSIFGLH